MISIKNLTINMNATSSTSDDFSNTQSPIDVREELINMLRIISEDKRFIGQTVVIPNDCGQYGFVQGEFNLPEILYFLADMLE